MALGSAQAFDDSEYPNFKGQWRRIPVPGVRGQISFDQHKDWGKGQGAPLTPEYQAIFEANLKIAGQGRQRRVARHLVPRLRHAAHDVWRRADRDRDHARPPPTSCSNWIEHGRAHLHRRTRLAGGHRADLQGYSIGKWVDTDGDGRFDVLEVETRGFKGPRRYEAWHAAASRQQVRRSRSASISTRTIPTSCTTRSR